MWDTGNTDRLNLLHFEKLKSVFQLRVHANDLVGNRARAGDEFLKIAEIAIGLCRVCDANF